MQKLSTKITQKPKLGKQQKIKTESTKPSAKLSTTKETENSQRRKRPWRRHMKSRRRRNKRVDPKKMENAAGQVMGRKTHGSIFNR